MDRWTQGSLGWERTCVRAEISSGGCHVWGQGCILKEHGGEILRSQRAVSRRPPDLPEERKGEDRIHITPLLPAELLPNSALQPLPGSCSPAGELRAPISAPPQCYPELSTGAFKENGFVLESSGIYHGVF